MIGDVRILVTGFEPFGGDPENASGLAVRGLVETWSDAEVDVELVTATLPVTFAGAPAALRAAVAAHEPDAVIAVGEAGGRLAITPERHGRNRTDARIPDEDGAQPRDEPIDDGPELRPSSFDADALVRELRAAGLPAEASDDAGGFVCNRIAVEVAGLEMPGGFVHVPAVRTHGTATVGAETDARADVAVTPSTLTVGDLARALEVVVRHVAGTLRRAGHD